MRPPHKTVCGESLDPAATSGVTPVDRALPHVPPRRAHATILLVEDHLASASALAFLLRLEGFTVLVAPTAKQAMEIAIKSEVDLVLSDLGLPDGDGRSLMRELHAIQGLIGIALTGRVLDTRQEGIPDDGFVKVVAKPIEFAELLGSVKDVLKVRGEAIQESVSKETPKGT